MYIVFTSLINHFILFFYYTPPPPLPTQKVTFYAKLKVYDTTPLNVQGGTKHMPQIRQCTIPRSGVIFTGQSNSGRLLMNRPMHAEGVQNLLNFVKTSFLSRNYKKITRNYKTKADA